MYWRPDADLRPTVFERDGTVQVHPGITKITKILTLSNCIEHPEANLHSP